MSIKKAKTTKKIAKKSAKVTKKVAGKKAKPIGEEVTPDSPPEETPTGKPPVKKPKKFKRRAKGVASVGADADDREIRYPNISTRLCVNDKPLTANMAKRLLGWEQENQTPFGNEYVREIKRYTGTKVRLYNDLTNRPLRPTNIETLKQEILRKKWKFNGEPIIISKTGMIHDGQHTLIALILAAQEWHENKDKWLPFWDTEPTIPKLLVVGIEEDDETINTIGTGAQRTLQDVMYRSPYFRDMSSSDHKRASRIASFAIQLLWLRTGASLNAYTPKRTHSESVSFLERHEKVLEAVRFVYQGDEEKKLSSIINPGYAAGLLYLMGASKTDPEDYRASDLPDENMIDFSNWDKACKFFSLIAKDDDSVKALKEAIIKRREGESRMSYSEVWATFCKAWECFITKQPITAKALALSYYEDDNGFQKLDECPVTGGIDIGDPKEADEALITHVDDPSEEEIEEKTEKLSKKRKKGKSEEEEEEREPVSIITPPKSIKKKKAKTSSGEFGVGQVVWVKQPKSEPFRGKIVELLGKNVKIKIYTGFQGAGNIVSARLTELSDQQPKEE